jgi:NADPH:quinone reductase-like Zn-dependent oxidoreductase
MPPTTTRAIRIHAPGGPEALTLDTVTLAEPGPGEILVRQRLAGVNFVDIYHRTGLYGVPALPAGLGVEAAGEVERVGPEVAGFREGDRIAYAGLPAGGYAESRILPAARAIRLPDAVGFDTAAAVLVRGLTAHMLFERVRPLRPGDTVLIHAAAGGLGLIATQWAKRRGATVIGTVGDARKAALARGHGADHTILYRETDFVAAVRAATAGRGADMAIEGIGGDTLLRTFDAMAPYGLIASVGQVGGSLPTIDVGELGPARSIALARPSVLRHYLPDLAIYPRAAAEVLAEVAAGLQPVIGAVYPLAEAAEAHRALEAGRTSGSVLLEL